jgi:hypothetical protein
MQPLEGDFQKDANINVSLRPIEAERAVSLTISMVRFSKERTNLFNQDVEELHWIFEST